MMYLATRLWRGWHVVYAHADKPHTQEAAAKKVVLSKSSDRRFHVVLYHGTLLPAYATAQKNSGVVILAHARIQ